MEKWKPKEANGIGGCGHPRPPAAGSRKEWWDMSRESNTIQKNTVGRRDTAGREGRNHGCLGTTLCVAGLLALALWALGRPPRKKE